MAQSRYVEVQSATLSEAPTPSQALYCAALYSAVQLPMYHCVAALIPHQIALSRSLLQLCFLCSEIGFHPRAGKGDNYGASLDH